MKVVILIVLFVILALIEIPKLRRKKQWRELLTSSVLLGIGFLLSLLQIVGVRVPNPNKGIEYLIKMITQ